jgi:hypothetical protein
MVKVMCGINSVPTDKVIGFRVSQVRDKFKDVLNIPKDARAMINGKQASNDDVVPDNVELEFVKETGEKGC